MTCWMSSPLVASKAFEALDQGENFSPIAVLVVGHKISFHAYTSFLSAGEN